MLEALSGKLTTTAMPNGKLIHMQPMASDMESSRTELSFPAKYGHHTGQVLAEAGLAEDEIEALAGAGVINLGSG